MCGIIGITAESPIFSDMYDGLTTLQHRGQDAAGMMTFDGSQFHSKRGDGLVRDVFRTRDAQRLMGHIGIGHCRYPTAGTYDPAEAQPFFVNAPFGLALVHNGNLTNTEHLRADLSRHQVRHMNTKSDSEILLNIFADELQRENMQDFLLDKLFAATKRTYARITGGYAVLILIAGQGILAFRDPQGLRPLALGRRAGRTQDEVMFASENVAMQVLSYEHIGDIAPGEAVFASHDGTITRRQIVPTNWAPCLFEFIYLARPESIIDGISVYKSRLRAGQHLADSIAAAHLDIDTVVPVPDSGRPAAIEIAAALGIPYREGLIKNRYIGRTFIMPNQTERKESIRKKLIPIPLELKDKNVLLVDDSIVRGNTSRQIIDMVRAAGAKKVYFASASPAVRYPDVYGIDMPTAAELIAHNLTDEEVRKAIGADALWYLGLPHLIAACQAGNPTITHFATHYFDGHYPTPEVTPAYLEALTHTRCADRGTTTAQLHLDFSGE